MTYPVAQLLTDSSFHPLRQGLAENAIKAALQDLIVTPIDAAQIREFIAELRSCKNISTGRVNKIVYTLLTWRRFIGPFTTNTAPDFYAGIEQIKTDQSKNGKPFKKNTVSDFVAILKQL